MQQPELVFSRAKMDCPELMDAALRNSVLGPPPCGAAALRSIMANSCRECTEASENWMCLHPGCGFVGCSRYINSHFLAHCEKTGHCLGKSFLDLSVYCNRCTEYVAYPCPDVTHLAAWESVMYEAKFGAQSPERFLDIAVRSMRDPNRSAMPTRNQNTMGGAVHATCSMRCGACRELSASPMQILTDALQTYSLLAPVPTQACNIRHQHAQ